MISSDTLSLLACQIAIPPTTSTAARDRHLRDTVARLRVQLSAHFADLVVLPELASIDYSRDAFERLDEVAEPLDGASFEAFSSLATEFGTHVCYSFARRDAKDAFISVAMVTPEGKLAGHYDKLHLCQYGASMEKEYFSAGSHIFVFDINGFTCAPIICYDIRFPELSRMLVLNHGVDVILHCGAYYRDPSFPTWHAFATSRAIENQVFLLSLNRAGENYGDSLFCYPWMDGSRGPEHFATHEEDLRLIHIDRQTLLDARETYTFLKDRWDGYDLPCHLQPPIRTTSELKGKTVI